MFKYQKADPEGHPRRRRRSIRLRQAEKAIFRLVSQGRGPSLPSEAACPLTLLRLRRRLPRDERRFPTAALASETATGWWISMRDTEPARTARRALMTGVPAPSRRLRLLPRRWSESVSGWGALSRTSAACSPLLIRPTWPETEAPSGEPRRRLLRHPAMGLLSSGPSSPPRPGLRCMQLPAPPGTPSQRGCRCRHHLDMQGIRHRTV